MSKTMAHVVRLSPEERAQLEEIVEHFEDAWRRGDRPAIDDHLPYGESRRWAALVELTHVDLEYRRKAGEAARVEQYLERYPQLAEDHEVVSDLAAAEFKYRRRGEPGVRPAEYAERFP